jgi:multidrug efflux pump subunit AcrA (membrane-fusion protein)
MPSPAQDVSISAPPAPQAVPAAPEPRPPRYSKWLILLGVLAVAALIWWALAARRTTRQAAVTGPVVRTTKISAGTFRNTIRLAGTTSARNAANISAPQMRGPDAGRALILMYLIPGGSYVKKGDVLVRIDAQAIKDHADDVHAQVVAAEADIRKRQAEHAIEMENLRQEVRVAKADLDKAALDFKAAEIRTPIDMEILKLAVEEAEANYKQLELNLPITAERQQSEIKILEYTRDRHSRHRDRHLSDVDLFVIRAPISGLAVMNQVWRGGEMGQVQEGDQVSPGQPFMKVVDTSSMQLDATVNQVDGEALRLGQRATVRFDAFAGLNMTGQVVALGAMGVGGWRQNYYVRSIPVRVAINGNDPRVIPDLSGGSDIILEEKPNMLLAPLESVHSRDGKDYIYVRKGRQFERREVQLGARNDVHVAVLEGLNAGEEIALSNPTLASAR